jgi:hypothetical protein
MQVDAIKDFIKSGKPVLACFGPDKEPPDSMEPPVGPERDGLEELLSQLGIRLGKQVVLFDDEAEAFSDRPQDRDFTAATVQVPPLEFDWKPGEGRPLGKALAAGELEDNPIKKSLKVTAHSLGRDKKFELRLRHPRPVYFEPTAGQDRNYDATFLLTSPASWNDDQPFPTTKRTPHYERPKPNDPDNGTVDMKRRGPFPIGVAVEVTLPADWYASDNAAPTSKVRIAAIGQGHFFVGTELSPAKEKLVVDVCNWLLGRDDQLPQEKRAWSFPRAHLTERDRFLWQWCIPLALPVTFIYLGFVVFLVRRVR